MKRLIGIVVLLMATAALGMWDTVIIDSQGYNGAPATFFDESNDEMYIGVVASSGRVRLYRYDSGAGNWVIVEGDVSANSTNQVPITVGFPSGTHPTLVTSDFATGNYSLNNYFWNSSWLMSQQSFPPYGEVYSLSSIESSSDLMVMGSYWDSGPETIHTVHTSNSGGWQVDYPVERCGNATPEYSRLLYDAEGGLYYYALYTIDGELIIEDDQFGTGWGSAPSTVVASGVISQFDTAIINDGTNSYIYVVYFDTTASPAQMKVTYANISTSPPYSWNDLPQIPIPGGGTHQNSIPAIELFLDSGNNIHPQVAFIGDQTGTIVGCFARHMPHLDEWMPEFFGTGITIDAGYLDMTLDNTGHPYIAFTSSDADIDLTSTKQLNFPPDPFDLIAPLEDEVFTFSDILFDWNDAVDFDNDTVNYTLELSTDTDFATWADHDSGTTSEITLYDVTDSEYYWQVRANDGSHVVYNRDHFWSFRVGADDNPMADSAEAFDVNSQPGIQDGDYVEIIFSEPLDPDYIPTATQLDNALPLSGGHTWLDGNGGVSGILLNDTNVPNDTLRIVLSVDSGVPTVAPSDTIDFDASNGLLVDFDGNPIIGQVIITGGFGPGDVPVFDTSWNFVDTIDYEGTNTLTCRIDPASPADAVYIMVSNGGYNNFTGYTMAYNSDGVWSWDLDGDYLGLNGIHYAFNAVNSSGSALYPAGYPNTTLAAKTAFENLTGPLELPPGNDVTDYRLVSVPALLDNPDANTQFADDFGEYDNSLWRLFIWDAYNETYYEYGIDSPDYLAPGGGFWLITKDGCSEISLHNGVGLPPDTDFSIPLYAGWNLIGNPFSFGIDWVDCNSGGLDVEEPITYGDGGYVPNQTVIYPGGGYWLWSNEDGELIIPPIGSETPPPLPDENPAVAELTPLHSGNMPLPELTNPAKSSNTLAVGGIGRESLAAAETGTAWGDDDSWRLAFTLSDGVSADSNHQLGVDPSASNHYDSLECHDPPGLGGLCNLWFESDWPSRSGSYRTDLREPFVEGSSWSFYATSPSNATLSWHQENGWPEGFAAVLETPAGRRIDLLAENSVSLTAAELASELPFQVFVGNEDYLDGYFSAREVSLSQSYPNPTTGLARIEFSLTEAAPVELAVYDLAGRRVALLSEGTRAVGRHAVGWDASEAAPGVYLYRLTVDGETVATRRLVVTR
jgi:hypothetical protein